MRRNKRPAPSKGSTSQRSSTTNWEKVREKGAHGKENNKRRKALVSARDTRNNRIKRRCVRNLVEPKSHDEVSSSSCEMGMDADLKLIVERVALSTQERQLRTKVFEDIRDLISSAFQNATVQLYGSSSTGLDTFRSDLDITVGNITLASSLQHLPAVVVADDEEEDEGEVKKLQQEEEAADGHMNMSSLIQVEEEEKASFSLNLALPVGTATSVDNAHITRRVQPTPASHWNPTLRRRKIRVLRALQVLLKSQRPHFQVKCLHKARIPILTVLDTKTKLAIDIGVNRELFQVSEHGRSTSLTQRLQDKLGAPFTTMVMFLKEFLYQFELDKPFTGGLGSFRLYMMVAYIFQQRSVKRTKQAQSPISSLLLAFFELFGNKKRPKFLHEDTQLPLPFGDSGHIDFGGVFRIDDCVETFAMAFDILSSTKNIGSIIYEERLEKDRKSYQKVVEQRLQG